MRDVYNKSPPTKLQLSNFQRYKYAQRKDVDRQRERRSNWWTEEIHDAGNGKGIFFIWGGLLVLDAQDPTVEWYTKIPAAD